VFVDVKPTFHVEQCNTFNTEITTLPDPNSPASGIVPLRVLPVIPLTAESHECALTLIVPSSACVVAKRMIVAFRRTAGWSPSAFLREQQGSAGIGRPR